MPWRREAHRRVRDHILPALAGTGAYLRVFLVDVEARGRLALGPEPNIESYLGFDPLVGFDPLKPATPLVTIVFEGQVPAAPAEGEPRADAERR